MRITVYDPAPNALLLCGVPFAAGQVPVGQPLELIDPHGAALPIWWEERAHWPDDSAKWIYLHARLSGIEAGEEPLVLELRPGGAACASLPPLRGDGLVLETQTPSVSGAAAGAAGAEAPAPGPAEFSLRVAASGWSLELGEVRLDVLAGTADRVATDPPLPVLGGGRLELAEASPIAPLLRLRQPGEAGLRFDHLIRLDPVAGSAHWQQRISFLTEEVVHLRRLGARLVFGGSAAAAADLVGAPGWTWVDLPEGAHPGPGIAGAAARLLISRPGVFCADGADEQVGHPEVGVQRGPAAVQVDDGWQRAPLALSVEGDAVEVELYPGDVSPLAVHAGTSFRHSVRVGLAGICPAPVRWSLDPEAACGSGAYGPLMARSARTCQRYPGYESAIGACLDCGRLSALEKDRGGGRGSAAGLLDEAHQDEEYFGLQHYGDWPMALGAYGGERRMYADNEYDTPYAYFLQFARTGQPEYLRIAWTSAVHMADVDCMATTGDMRFHGYRDTADDHGEHRSQGGELGHYWTDGLVLNWLLCGDRWSWEAARAQTRYLMGVFAGEGDDPIRRHFLGCERAVGWPMVALAGVAEITGEAELLDKMRQMAAYLARFTADADRELEEIDTLGGEPLRWWRVSQQDGSKPFMLGVVLEALERYHRLTADPNAESAIVAISRFLVDVMWVENVEAFIYEWNAYNRGHREESYPHYINMMVAPGLAYAHELTGDPVFREVATRAFHAALWTLFAPGGGKEIGMVGRTSALMVGRLHEWKRRDEAARDRRLTPSRGVPFAYEGSPKGLAQRCELTLRQGRPEYRDGALVSAGESFAVYGFRDPAGTDRGEIAFTVTPDWDCPSHPGPVAQRAYLHLADAPFTSACVSVISFYTGLHVRFYDAERHYIEVLETDIQDWKAGVPHRVEIGWDVGDGSSGVGTCRAPTLRGARAGGLEAGNARVARADAPATTSSGEAWLRIDGVERDRRPLTRRLSGSFRRLHLGHRPGNWRADGTIGDLSLRLG